MRIDTPMKLYALIGAMLLVAAPAIWLAVWADFNLPVSLLVPVGLLAYIIVLLVHVTSIWVKGPMWLAIAAILTVAGIALSVGALLRYHLYAVAVLGVLVILLTAVICQTIRRRITPQ